MSIAPGQGQHQLLFAFDLPYDRKLDFNLSSPVAVDAAIVMLPPTGGVRLKSEQLVDSGERTVQGMAFQMYQAASTLGAGEAIRLSLSGNAGESAGSQEDTLTMLLLGVGIFGVVLAGAGVWLYRQRAALTPVAEGVEGVEIAMDETSESILETILTLDDQHASGSLPDAVYFERRAELKARLAEAVAREENAS
jgi:hypothetical protein